MGERSKFERVTHLRVPMLSDRLVPCHFQIQSQFIANKANRIAGTRTDLSVAQISDHRGNQRWQRL